MKTGKSTAEKIQDLKSFFTFTEQNWSSLTLIPFKIDLHTFAHLQGLVSGKNISDRQGHGSNFT